MRQIVRRHLPAGGQRILDTGGGTGVHAAWLTQGFLLDDDPAAAGMMRQDLADGQHRNPDGRERFFTTAYFHRPDELAAELADADLAIREIVGVEGLAGWLPHLLADRWSDPLARERIVWAAAAIEAEPSLRGLSPHLLAVAEVL